MLAEPKLIETLWPHVWPLISSAVKFETEQDVLGALLRAERFLLIVGDGVAVIRNCDTFLEINYVGGKKAANWWPEMSKQIDAMAKAFNSQRIVALGTAAWKKLAPDYEPTKQILYVKEVA